jgi:hypothetical protein
MELLAGNRLWAAQFEVLAQVEHSADVRHALAAQDRPALGLLFNGVDPAADERGAALLGGFNQALLTGIMAQWLIDPETALSGREIAEAIAVIARSF